VLRTGQQWVDCYDLRPGVVNIQAESFSDKNETKEFTVKAYIGSSNSQSLKTLTITNHDDSERWRLGRIHISQGKSKDPIEANVQYLEQPEAVKK
jgi:hypothetical protein